MIERCKFCNSILEVEENDLNINNNYDIYYICPVCYMKNILFNNRIKAIKLLNKIKVRLNQIYDKIYLVN